MVSVARQIVHFHVYSTPCCYLFINDIGTLHGLHTFSSSCHSLNTVNICIKSKVLNTATSSLITPISNISCDGTKKFAHFGHRLLFKAKLKTKIENRYTEHQKKRECQNSHCSYNMKWIKVWKPTKWKQKFIPFGGKFTRL